VTAPLGPGWLGAPEAAGWLGAPEAAGWLGAPAGTAPEELAALVVALVLAAAQDAPRAAGPGRPAARTAWTAPVRRPTVRPSSWTRRGSWEGR
jgi:hypothetical protein